MILALLALVPVTTAAQPRDGSVRVDRSVIESLGPPPPAPRVPGGAPRAGGLPLAPETVPQAAPPRRPVQRPARAPSPQVTRPAAPALPLPLPPEEPAEMPPLATSAPLPLPPTPPPVVAAPAPAPPPSVAAPVPAPPAEVAAPEPTRPAEVAAPRPAPPPAAPAAAPAAPRAPGPPPERVRLLFAPDAQELTEAMRAELRALAGALPDSDALRLTVNAYAGGDPANPSLARRASLSRALAVRTALMEAGVRSTRIDVRALGLNAGDGPPDRVDVLVGSPR
jgi:outer membrane protein OmpA-like peptidoglycan-associated protein